tara:strand:- start:374 stop:1420 length:1047 start_codon:yes stop_codon:yes gene_type:complete
MNQLKCIFNLNEIECTFNNKKCYGGYCWKHRKNYLLDNNCIIIDRFTSYSNDYTIKELKYFCNRFIKSTKETKSFKKTDYFTLLDNFYLCNKYSIKTIVKIQSCIRLFLIQQTIKLHGSAILNRNKCNNEEDFYTYDPINEIDPLYFFSYKDNQNKFWGFDVRSINKLIDMNYGNPYTTESIHEECKLKVYSLINYLKTKGLIISIENSMIIDRKSLVKQRFVDFFSQMEYSGYSCNVQWILDLHPVKLKRLYRELEDIWNYRANLSENIKCEIVPPHGRLLIMPVSDYNNCNVKLDLQEILSKELIKICSSSIQSSMNLGFMYVIIALSIVSHPCYMVHHEWVQYVF